MNGHTYLRTYRGVMYLGALCFMGTLFIYSMPDEYQVEEYFSNNKGELL